MSSLPALCLWAVLNPNIWDRPLGALSIAGTDNPADPMLLTLNNTHRSISNNVTLHRNRHVNLHPDREAGSVSTFFVIITLAVIAAAGLVVDGGRKVAALAEARDIADNAARACAQVLNPVAARTGDTALDPASATAAGQDFLARTGHAGTVVVAAGDNQACTVEVRIEVATVFLPGPYVVASAQSAVGLNQP